MILLSTVEHSLVVRASRVAKRSQERWRRFRRCTPESFMMRNLSFERERKNSKAARNLSGDEMAASFELHWNNFTCVGSLHQTQDHMN